MLVTFSLTYNNLNSSFQAATKPIQNVLLNEHKENYLCLDGTGHKTIIFKLYIEMAATGHWRLLRKRRVTSSPITTEEDSLRCNSVQIVGR